MGSGKEYMYEPIASVTFPYMAAIYLKHNQYRGQVGFVLLMKQRPLYVQDPPFLHACMLGVQEPPHKIRIQDWAKRSKK